MQRKSVCFEKNKEELEYRSEAQRSEDMPGKSLFSP
jgi:hypothetical protein